MRVSNLFVSRSRNEGLIAERSFTVAPVFSGEKNTTTKIFTIQFGKRFLVLLFSLGLVLIMYPVSGLDHGIHYSVMNLKKGYHRLNM